MNSKAIAQATYCGVLWFKHLKNHLKQPFLISQTGEPYG